MSSLPTPGEAREASGVPDTELPDRRLMEAHLARSQRFDSLGSFARGFAHDMNNVLQPLVMAIDLLTTATDLDQVRELGETLSATAARGAELVRKLTLFARGPEGKRLPMQPQYIARDLTRIVYDTFPKNIVFRMRVADPVPMVLVDPTQMHQVLLNLCVNAREAMPHGGELTLSVESLELDEPYASRVNGLRPGCYVVFTVSDTGLGIPAELHDKVFEPFFTTKPVGGGAGLGLATVMVLVRGHAGYLTLESQPDRGSTFKVYIPSAAAPETGRSTLPPRVA